MRADAIANANVEIHTQFVVGRMDRGIERGTRAQAECNNDCRGEGPQMDHVDGAEQRIKAKNECVKQGDQAQKG
jgi:hypothetical protein